MVEVEITKVSSKGQVVIPQDMRNEMDWKEGDALAVTRNGDTLLMKKVRTPSKEEMLSEWGKFNKEGRKLAKKRGIKESDVPKLIHRARGVKE